MNDKTIKIIADALIWLGIWLTVSIPLAQINVMFAIIFSLIWIWILWQWDNWDKRRE